MFNRSNKEILFIRWAALLLVVTQILLGGLWIIYNFQNVPPHGDTCDYIKLSNILRVDEYRTILYPLIIRITRELALLTTIKFSIIIYLFQMFISFCSIFYFYYVMFSIIEQKKSDINIKIKKNNKLLISIFSSLFIFTNPLIAHFNLSILTDSLATSFTLIFLTAVSKYFLTNRVSFTLYLLTILSFIAMAITRVEKLYFGILTLLIYIFFKVLIKLKNKKRDIQKPLLFTLIVLIISASMTIFINKLTQTANYGRPHLSITYMKFSIIVWPRMSKIYFKLPDDLRKKITEQDAINFDKRGINIMPFVQKMSKEDPKGTERTLKTITQITLREYPYDIVLNLLFDFIRYIFAPITFILELIFHQTRWTSIIYRTMSTFHPLLSKIYLGYFIFVFMIIQIPLFILSLKSEFRTHIKPITEYFLLFFIGVVVNSFLLTLVGQRMNIRYALPGYIIIILYFAMANIYSYKSVVSCKS